MPTLFATEADETNERWHDRWSFRGEIIRDDDPNPSELEPNEAQTTRGTHDDTLGFWAVFAAVGNDTARAKRDIARHPRHETETIFRV